MVACHVVNGFVTVKNNVDDYAFEFLWAMRKHGKQAAVCITDMK